MKKSLILILLLICMLVSSCSFIDGVNNNNDEIEEVDEELKQVLEIDEKFKQINNEKSYVNFFDFEVIEKLVIRRGTFKGQKCLKLNIIKNYNTLFPTNDDGIDLDDETTKQITIFLNVSDIVYQLFNVEDKLIYKLVNYQGIYDENQKAFMFSSLENDYQLIPYSNGVLFRSSVTLSKTRRISSEIAAFLGKPKCFLKEFNQELIIDYPLNIFGIASKSLFEISLLKHYDIDHGGEKWHHKVLRASISSQDPLADLNKYNSSVEYHSIPGPLNLDGFYLYVVLNPIETINQTEITADYFKYENSNFDELITEITELNLDKYLEIKKRLNGETVSEDIMNIDINNYHREFILRLKGDYNYRNFPLYLICSTVNNIEYIGYDHLNFIEAEKSYVYHSNFIQVRLSEVIMDDGEQVLAKYNVLKKYNNQDEIGETINLLVPKYIFSVFDDSYTFIYELNEPNIMELDNNEVYSYYNVDDNKGMFIPLYNDFFFNFFSGYKIKDKLFSEWASYIQMTFQARIVSSFEMYGGFSDSIFEFSSEKEFSLLVDLIKYCEKHQIILMSDNDNVLLSYLLADEEIKEQFLNYE